MKTKICLFFNVSSRLRVMRKSVYLLPVMFCLFFAPVTAWASKSNELSVVDYQSLFTQAETALAKKDYVVAQTKWLALLKYRPADFAVRNNLAVTYMYLNQYEKAKQVLKDVIASQAILGQAFYNLNQLHAYDAQQAYRQVFKKVAVAVPTGKLVAFSVDDVLTTKEARKKRVLASHQSVLNQVENWRIAWSHQVLMDYLSFYKTDFTPDKDMSSAQWRHDRQLNLSRSKSIVVTLENITITSLAKDFISVEFTQRYQSNRFKDKVVKTLIWQNISSNPLLPEWRIAREKVLNGA